MTSFDRSSSQVHSVHVVTMNEVYGLSNRVYTVQ